MKKSLAITRAEQLFDYAISKPDGFTRPEACIDLEMTWPEFNSAVHRLRKILGYDDITLVCDPAGMRQPWTYRLSGELDSGSAWVSNRLRDSEARFTTIENVVKPLVSATDGRTTEGRRARVILRAVTRLREDLSDIEVLT